jgi:hypothetical protein
MFRSWCEIIEDKNFAIFFVSSILIYSLAFLLSKCESLLTEAGVEILQEKMAIGQISETLFYYWFLCFLPVFGFKKTILVGMLAWAIVMFYLLMEMGDDLKLMLII